MSAKYTAEQVTDWFLVRNRIYVAEMDDEMISNMKIHKLLYYAQGAYVALTGEALFDDAMEAWTHGPVVASVYGKFRSFGSSGIVSDEIPSV